MHYYLAIWDDSSNFYAGMPFNSRNHPHLRELGSALGSGHHTGRLQPRSLVRNTRATGARPSQICAIVQSFIYLVTISKWGGTCSLPADRFGSIQHNMPDGMFWVATPTYYSDQYQKYQMPAATTDQEQPTSATKNLNSRKNNFFNPVAIW